jgi:hypothetical protein
METKDHKARLRELYLPSSRDFSMVDVPDMQYAMVDGEGGPNSEAFRPAIKWLFSTIFPIKQVAKQRMGKDFVEPPLECLWWADDIEDFIHGKRDRFKWRLMIVTADWVTDDMFADGAATASRKLGQPPDSLRLGRLSEGTSVQILHIGTPAGAAPTLARLHKEFLPANNLSPNGHHHEIYLNDPSRVAPEKLRTVFRQPVRPRLARTINEPRRTRRRRDEEESK